MLWQQQSVANPMSKIMNIQHTTDKRNIIFEIENNVVNKPYEVWITVKMPPPLHHRLGIYLRGKF